jgi:Zn-dependent protease
MSSSTPNEFQSLVLKLRLPLIWIGGVVLAWGIYKTYAFHRKEQQMYAFLHRHPVDSEQANHLRKAIGLHGDAVAWKLLGVGLALLILGLLLHQILALFRKDSR